MIDRLLSTLSHVRAGRDQTWTARCPSHRDRDPSLSIRLLPDQRILIHCHAGCTPGEVVSAIGMTLADLMPPRPRDTVNGPGGYAPLPMGWRTQNLLAMGQHEALVVVLALEREWRGEDLSLEDEDRVFEAARRLREFAEQ
jgi:hypothetical protein